ncbi:MAG: diadenosine tetraphosphate hydrolase [Ktedonobacterales bacterium]|nr:diadenosine tetraphosphate hydrolase [Ktedonobacterales bacterium]
MPEWLRDPIGAAERGENPTVLRRMPSGYAVIGNMQLLPGYCLLLAVPRVTHLTDLAPAARRQFLFDMSVLGEAVEHACRPYGLRRLNYEILGNGETFVHAHIFPRYHWEPAERLTEPVWRYPREIFTDAAYAYAAVKHGELKRDIEAALATLSERADQG